jgi:hypothetical protein
VCQACSLTRRCKSAMGVGICEPLAEGKGVRGDAESEGSPRQILGLRYTNHIRGFRFRTSLQNKTKSKISPGGTGINVADI